MPPKSNAQGQKPRSGKSNESGPKSVDPRRPIERGMAPTSTRDPAKQQVNKELLQRDKKELISVFQEQLDIKHIESEQEIRRTAGQIHYLRRENERIQRKQISEYGMTLDTLDDLKSNIDTTKYQNDKLYEDMSQTKDLHDQLEINLRETQQRYDDMVNMLNEFKKESKDWKSTKEQCTRAETRCQDLTKSNKDLKLVLLKHHIDPQADASALSRETTTSVKMETAHPVSPRQRKLTVRGRFDDVFGDEVEAIRKINKADLRRGFGVPDAIFDQVSPAYLGYYVRQRQQKEEHIDYYRPGLTLPKVFSRY